MSALRVVHYVNQFFGRIGAEEAGEHPFTVKEGPVGPGIGLQKELGDAGTVVATLICGDNRAATDLEAFGAEVEKALRGAFRRSEGLRKAEGPRKAERPH